MPSRGLAIAGGIVAVLIVAIVAYFMLSGGEETVETAQAPEATIPVEETAPAAEEAAETNVPTFDIVRVEKTGQTVAAGRAEPGATVRLKDGDTVLGEAVADSRGEWVIVLEEALPPGDHQLTLEAVGKDGETLASEQTVAVSVPDQPDRETLVVLQSPDAPSRVLQGTGVVSEEGELTLDVVDYGKGGTVIFSGKTAPDAPVRVYVDNEAVGDDRAGDDGRWEVTANKPIAPGVHDLRVDQLNEAGEVLARLEVPFERATQEEVDLVLRDGKVVIQPGNNLWTIARKLYGSGFRYTVIYQANKSQIRDPNLIYPGQVFTTPGTSG